MKEPELVLGLVGLFCSGKGSVTEYLVKNHGFKSSSFSDRIREELASRHQEPTRENLQTIAGQMRQEFGPAVLAIKTWEHIQQTGAQKAVVETPRSVEEVEYLKKLPNFYLIEVYADPKVRFERMKVRNREQDPQTWEDFLKSQEKDMNADGRSIGSCIEKADFKIENNGTPEELNQKIEELLQKIDE